MQILIIESDRELRRMMAADIHIFLRKWKPQIINVWDLDEAAGTLADPGRNFNLVVCAETVNDTTEGTKDGNGLRMMQSFWEGKPKYRVIIIGHQPDDPLPFDVVERNLEPRSATIKELQNHLFKAYKQ